MTMVPPNQPGTMPVLVLSGHVIGLGVARALGAASIPVHIATYETGDFAHASRYVHGRFETPKPADTAAFIQSLLEIGRETGPALLVPGDDASLLAISRNRSALETIYRLACPPMETVEKFVDKTTAYQLVGAAGVPVPRTLYVHSAKEAGDAAEEIGYPCIVKPTESHFYYDHFGVKFRHVSKRSEAEAAFTEARDAGVKTMVQEFIVGDDRMGVNYNAYAVDGETKVEFTARKARMSPPGEGVPSLVRSARVEEVMELGRKALKAVGLSGYSCTEFKWDERKKRYVFFEINGRYNRSNLLATCCGINFPAIEYNHRIHGKTPAAAAFREKVWWVDEFKDLSSFPRWVRLSPANILTFWRPHLWRPRCATFSWSDPMPFLYRACHYARSFWSRITRGGPSAANNGKPPPP